MGGEASKQIDKDVLWGGGRSPFSVTYGKMMMWFFLVSDALTFSGLLISLGFFRTGVFGPLEGFWPVGEKVFEALPGLTGEYPLYYVALMTFLLIISSVTMVLAVEAGHRNDRKGVTVWMAATIVGGFFFLGSQAWEWSHFIHGSGGNFTLGKEITVAGLDQNGEEDTRTFKPMDKVFYGADHAHAHHDHEDGHHEDGHHEDHDKHDGHEHAMVSGMGGVSGHGADEEHSELPQVLYFDKYLTSRLTVRDPATIEKIMHAKDMNFAETSGANLHENEYGPQQYANFFFFVTGFHGFHVFSGVVINIIIFIMVLQGVMEKRGHYEMIEKTGLYWHFVDLVWVFVFTFFYLV